MSDADAHPSVDDLFAHVGGYLALEESSAIERHLVACEPCREAVAEVGRALVSELHLTHGSLPGLAASARPPRPLPAIGDQVGRYRLVELLGRGAMGIVYAAHDPELDRMVAVKLVRTGYEGDASEAELEARLLAEAQAMARLSHKNVVSVYDIGTLDGAVWLAMELVKGTTLRGWLEAAPRTWREIVGVYLQAGEGLAAAHAAGIVHRDFKPDNVLVEASGRVCVGDFGLARVSFGTTPEHGVTLSSSDLRRTRVGTIIGTPAYMAPEQLGHGDVDARADVFAFGACLYEALYRKRPYPGATLGELERALLRGIPDEPPPAKVPGFVRRVVMRALEGDRERRFASMRELLVALHRDPRRRALQVGLPLAALVLVLGAVAAIYQMTTAPARACRASAGLADPIWSPARQEAARRAFSAVGLDFAGDAFARASHGLDAYLAEWRRARVEACDATHERAVQSEELLDLRLGCLNQSLLEARALVDRLEVADRATIERASEAVGRLPAVASCAEVERLRDRVRMPADPRAAAVVGEVRELVARARAEDLTGAFAASQATAEEAYRRARAIAHAPSEAAALGVLASATFSLGDRALAKERYRLATWRALAGGDDRFAASAAIGYSFVAGLAMQFEEAVSWSELAEVEIERIGGDAALELERLIQLGGVYFDFNAKASVLGELERALAAYQAEHASADPLMVRALESIALQHGLRERFVEARAAFERALELSREVLGQRHPRTLGITGNLVMTLVQGGRFTEAEALLAPYDLALARSYPDTHPDRLAALFYRDWLARGLGQFDRAEAANAESERIERAALGDDLALLAETRTAHAQTLVAAGRIEASLAKLDEASAFAAKYLPPDAPILLTQAVIRGLALEGAGRFAEARATFEGVAPRLREGQASVFALALDGIGRALLRDGEPAAAIARHEAALAIAEQLFGSDNPMLVPTLRDLGAALLAAGDRTTAAAALERALAILAARAADPLLGAEVRLVLAAVITPDGEARAARLTGEALETLLASPYPRAAAIRLARAPLE